MTDKYYYKEGKICPHFPPKSSLRLIGHRDCLDCLHIEGSGEGYVKCNLMTEEQLGNRNPLITAKMKNTELAKDLTKREHFAFEILKKIWDDETRNPSKYDPDNTMEMRAVHHADELIKALNKEKEMKHWDASKGKNVEATSITAFLNEIIEVSKKHGFSISHEDTQGGFVVEPFSEENTDWLMQASFDMEEKNETP